MELNNDDYIIIKTEEFETDDHDLVLRTLEGDIETVVRTADIESSGNDFFTRSREYQQGKACKSVTCDTRLQKVCSANAINDDKTSTMSDKLIADVPTTHVSNSYVDSKIAYTSVEVVGRHLTGVEDYTPESNTSNYTIGTGNQEMTGFDDGQTLIYEEKGQYDEQFAVYLNEDKEENYPDEDDVDIKVEGCSVKSSIVPFPDNDNIDSRGEKSDDKIQPDQNHETSTGLTQTSHKRISESQHLILQKKKSENEESSQVNDDNAEDSESELEGEKDSVGAPAEKSQLTSDISQSFLCVACGVSFTSAGRFQRHIYDSTKSMQPRLWGCPLCNEKLLVRNRCKAYQHINRHDIPFDVLKEIQMKNTQRETFITSSLTVDQVSQSCSHDPMHTESKDKEKGSAATTEDLHHGFWQMTSERYNCLVCPRLFAYHWTLHNHLVKCKPSHELMCKQCSLILPSRCALTAHSILHDPGSSKKPFMCPECGRCFSGSWSSFAEHVLNECLHGNRVYILRCPVCNKMVNHAAELTCHMEMHIVEYFECKICFEAFISKQSLFDHRKEAHNGSKGAGTFGMRTECPHCSKTFYTDEEEKKHMTQHVNEAMNTAMFGFMCFDCEEETVFSTKEHLLVHKSKIHSKPDDNLCLLCEKEFSSNKKYLFHMEKVHKMTDLDNSGELVTMLSAKKKYLRRKDTQQVKYLCHLCKNKFISKKRFLNHMKKLHDILYQDTAFQTSEESVGKIHVIEIDVAVEDPVSSVTEDKSSCSTTSDCQESPSSVSNTIDYPSSTSGKMPTPVSVMKVQPTTEALALNKKRTSVSCAAPQAVLVKPSDTDKVVDHSSSLPPATTESHLTETFNKPKQKIQAIDPQSTGPFVFDRTGCLTACVTPQSAVKAVTDSSLSSSILRKKQGRSSYTVVMEPLGSRLDQTALTEAEAESVKLRYKYFDDGKYYVFPTALASTEKSSYLDKNKCSTVTEAPQQVKYLCHLCKNKFISKKRFLNHMKKLHGILYQDTIFQTSKESGGKIHMIEIDAAVEDPVFSVTEDKSSCSTTSDCQESPSSVSNTIDYPSSTSGKMRTSVSVMKVQPTTEALALNKKRTSVSCAAPQAVLVKPSDTDKVVDHSSSLPPATTESHLTETFNKPKQKIQAIDPQSTGPFVFDRTGCLTACVTPQSAVKAVTDSSLSSSILRKKQGRSSYTVVMEPLGSRLDQTALTEAEAEAESVKLRNKSFDDGKYFVFPPALASTEKSSYLDKNKCSTVTEAPQAVVLQTLGNSSEKYTTHMLPKPPKLIMGPVAKFTKTKTSEIVVVRPKGSLTVLDNANDSSGFRSDVREGKDSIPPVASASSVHTTKSVIHPKPTVIKVMPQMTSPGMPRTNVPVAGKVITLSSNTNVSSTQTSPSEANRLKYDIRKCSDVVKTKEPKKYHCAECKTVFTSASKLKKHMSSQERVKFTPILICYKCRMVVPNRCALELHENLHSDEHKMPAACPECGLLFYCDWDIFMKHVTKECLHHRRVCCIMCSHCDKAIPTARFMGHFQQEHVPKWIFSFDTCMFCSKKHYFFSREVVRDHYAFHIKKLSMRDITFQFGCVTCRSNTYPDLFHDLEELWEHVITFHQGIRSFTCTNCPLKFSFPESVDAHIASHHSHLLSVIPEDKVSPQTSMRLEFSETRPTMKEKGNEEVETCASEAVAPVATEVVQLSPPESRKVKLNVEHQFHKTLEEKVIMIEQMENLERKSDTVVVPRKITCGHCADVFLNEETRAAHVRSKHTSESERCVNELSCVKVCVSRVYDGTHFFCSVCDKKQKYQKFASSNQLMLHLQKDHPTGLSENKSPETRVKCNTELDVEDNITESSPRAASERVSFTLPASEDNVNKSSPRAACESVSLPASEDNVTKSSPRDASERVSLPVSVDNVTESSPRAASERVSLSASEKHRLDDHEPSKSVDGAKNKLECIWCSSVLKSVHYLQKHVTGHHFKSGEFKCTFCGKEGLPYGRLVCHVAKRCPKNMNVTCPYCFENDFDNYKRLVTHLHQNHRLQLESCGMDDVVNTRRDIVSNICTCTATRCDVASKDDVAESTTKIVPTVACPPLQKVSAEFQAHSCKFCGLKCNTRLHFLCHVAECHSGYLPSMFCPFCEERNIETAFGSVKALKMHLSSQHCDSDEKRAHCDYCDDNTSNTVISIHPRPSYQEIDVNKIRCRVCFKEYSKTRVGFLVKHMKEAHAIHACRVCKTEFDAQTDLDKHMDDEHGQQEGINEVEHEDVSGYNKKKFEKTDTHKYPKRLLRVNTKTNQDVIDKSQEKSLSELKCSICSKTFAKSGFLLKHRRTQHSIYCCKFCRVTCDSEQDLDSHIFQIHDDMVPQLTCSICKARGVQKIFHDQKLLEKHLGQKHEKRPVDSPPPSPPPMKRLRVEGDSVYTCAKCSFVTDDAAKFSEHIKDHNTDKASQCPECGLCFTILPALKKHLFVVHKIRDSEKYLEDKGMKTEEEELDFDAMMEPYKNR